MPNEHRSSLFFSKYISYCHYFKFVIISFSLVHVYNLNGGARKLLQGANIPRKKKLKIKLRTQKNKKKKIDSIKLGLMIFHSIKIIYNSFELNL